MLTVEEKRKALHYLMFLKKRGVEGSKVEDVQMDGNNAYTKRKKRPALPLSQLNHCSYRA
jgi:hypothetical protein